jgi:hypothetical protein
MLVLTSYIAPVEFSMHNKGFRYKKCTHFTVGTNNVYLNPGKGIITPNLFVTVCDTTYLETIALLSNLIPPFGTVRFAKKRTRFKFEFLRSEYQTNIQNCLIGSLFKWNCHSLIARASMVKPLIKKINDGPYSADHYEFFLEAHNP